MTTAPVAPSVVANRRLLGDLELVLDGVLPAGHLLGGPVGTGTTPPLTGLQVDAGVAEAALRAGSLRLVDEEQTPLAELTDVRPEPGGLRGVARRIRRRESGAGRAAALDLSAAPAAPAAGSPVVVVLGRPALLTDEPTLLAALDAAVETQSERLTSTSTLLLLVPDDSGDTAGVPTHLMTTLAGALADRVSAARPATSTTVATVPLAWRDPQSDRLLVEHLRHHLGGRASLLLSADPELDPNADAWADVGAALRTTAPSGVDLVLDPEDRAVLSRWKRPPSTSGLVLFFTGFSGSGKSTIARAVHERLLVDGQRTVTLLDGDVVRQMLSSGLGFDRAGRALNIRRIGFVAAEIARHGGIAICAPVAPYDAGRREARAMAEAVGDFLLVHVSTPLEECERRDLKGLYAKARAGIIPEFTGISDPYEVPTDADLVIDTTDITTDAAVARIVDRLVAGGWIEEKPA